MTFWKISEICLWEGDVHTGVSTYSIKQSNYQLLNIFTRLHKWLQHWTIVVTMVWWRFAERQRIPLWGWQQRKSSGTSFSPGCRALCHLSITTMSAALRRGTRPTEKAAFGSQSPAPPLLSFYTLMHLLCSRPAEWHTQTAGVCCLCQQVCIKKPRRGKNYI